jgi:DNA modification methylase
MSTIQIPPVEPVSVSLLKVDGQNPNRMTKDQHERLATSIKKYGFIVPVITNRDLLIADGEQRFEVAKSLGMAQVPVIRLEVEDVDRRLLRQVLNKLRGEHELIADALEFEKIIGAGREDDLKHLLDLNDSQLERYLTEIHEPKPEDYEIPEIDKIHTDIKRGDIYILGKHRLMCGDAAKKHDVEDLMNGQKAEVVCTDPPYGIGKDIEGDDREGVEFDKWNETWLSNLIIEDNAPLISYHSTRTFPSLVNAAERTGWHFERALWYYRPDKFPVHTWHNWMLTSQIILLFSHSDIIFQRKEPADHDCYSLTAGSLGKERLHPTQKLPMHIKQLLSHFAGNTVLDLFGGSGSTLIACEQTGRVCYMMEIDPRYCQVIVDRWEKYTGQKAVKTGENNVPANSNREDS